MSKTRKNVPGDLIITLFPQELEKLRREVSKHTKSWLKWFSSEEKGGVKGWVDGWLEAHFECVLKTSAGLEEHFGKWEINDFPPHGKTPLGMLIFERVEKAAETWLKKHYVQPELSPAQIKALEREVRATYFERLRHLACERAEWQAAQDLDKVMEQVGKQTPT